MASSESNIQPYTDVVMNKAVLDWEMQCLQTKIKCKNEENSKLENQIAERKNDLQKLKKMAKSTCEREEKVKNNINMLRNSRAITEGLLMSMKHQLLINEQKRIETKNTRDQILKKYSALFESYSKIYSSLPWIKKTTELRISVERRKIELNILKLEYSSFKKKVALFHKIGGQRVIVAITKLAKAMVARNNLKKEINDLFSHQKKLEIRESQLKEEKIKLQEKIDLKVKEAVAEARERVVKAQVGGNTGEKFLSSATTAPTSMPSSVYSQKSSIESIYSRLGLFAPPSLKRAMFSRPTIEEKIPRLEEMPKMREVSEKVVVEDSVSIPNEVIAAEEMSTETTEKPEECPSQVAEPVHVPKVNNKEVGANIAKKVDKKKKKLKKKIKKDCQLETGVSAQTQEKEKDVGKVLVTKKQGVIEETVLKKTVDETNNKPMEKERQDTEQGVEVSSIAIQEVLPEKRKSGESTPGKQSENPIKLIEESQQHKTSIINETDDSNMSILDNISVLSSTFTSENRNQIARSPDYLTQTPQGYCFSPVYSPTKTDISEISSVKGAKSPTYDFPTSSALNPLFDMGAPEKDSGAPSSDFTSFFSSGTSKNNEKPAKNFFQLFG